MGFTNENFNNSRQIGQDPNTYGYHSDSSFVYDNNWCECNQKGGKVVVQDLGVGFDFSYTMGDTVGAGINYVTGEIFFTKNGILVALMPCNLKITLYPSIGFKFWDDRKPTVEVNFKGPYIFNVSHYMQHSNLKTPRKWSLQPKLAFPPFLQ
jgi:hypothetical protein